MIFELLSLITFRFGVGAGAPVGVGDSGGSFSSLTSISWYCCRYGRKVEYEVITD